MANIENLRDNYNDKLLKYLKTSFYEVVATEKNRNNYKKAATYVGTISRLNNGESLVLELINELKNSGYSKRIALFDEIKKVIIQIGMSGKLKKKLFSVYDSVEFDREQRIAKIK